MFGVRQSRGLVHVVTDGPRIRAIEVDDRVGLLLWLFGFLLFFLLSAM